MATATETTDLDATQAAVGGLTQAVELLSKVAADMNGRAIDGTGIQSACAIVAFTQVALRNAQRALMNATSELKLAQHAA
jgi:hypothetical protein